MKNSRSIVESRRERILKLLEINHSLKIEYLANEMKTSPLTIRRDLEYFENLKIVERFHGGVSLVFANFTTNMFSSVLTLHKHAIAKCAAELVEDGDTIFINTSSTALLMLKYITAKMVTVITNNGKALMVDTASNLFLVLTGGELRSPKESMVGDFAINNLLRVTATKSFLGCSGISARSGFTTAVLQEVAINELMLNNVTGKRYVLADKSKIGKTASFFSGELRKVNCIITDTEADAAVLQQLNRLGVEIVQVEPLKNI